MGEGTLRDAVRGVVLGRVGVSRGSCGRADADKWRDSPLSLESMRGVICERYFLSHWSAVFSKRLYSVALPTRDSGTCFPPLGLVGSAPSHYHEPSPRWPPPRMNSGCSQKVSSLVGSLIELPSPLTTPIWYSDDARVSR